MEEERGRVGGGGAWGTECGDGPHQLQLRQPLRVEEGQEKNNPDAQRLQRERSQRRPAPVRVLVLLMIEQRVRKHRALLSRADSSRDTKRPLASPLGRKEKPRLMRGYGNVCSTYGVGE